MNSKENDSIKKDEKNIILNDINIININSNILKKENNEKITNENNNNNNNNDSNENNNFSFSNRKRSTNSNYNKIINIDEELEKILSRFSNPEPIIQIRNLTENIYLSENTNQSILKEINFNTNLIIFNKKELEYFEKINKRNISKICIWSCRCKKIY